MLGSTVSFASRALFSGLLVSLEAGRCNDHHELVSKRPLVLWQVWEDVRKADPIKTDAIGPIGTTDKCGPRLPPPGRLSRQRALVLPPESSAAGCHAVLSESQHTANEVAETPSPTEDQLPVRTGTLGAYLEVWRFSVTLNQGRDERHALLTLPI